MKIRLSFILTFFAMNVQQAIADGLNTNEWGVVNCSARMSIDLKDSTKEIKTNQPVNLLIRIQNISTNDTIFIYHSLSIVANSLVNFSFVVISPSGIDVSPTPVEHYNGGSAGTYSIGPGQIKEFNYDLSYLCKFDEIGTYRIIAKKRLWPDTNKQCEVVSNPLNIVVSK